jgi:hypothetical protein
MNFETCEKSPQHRTGIGASTLRPMTNSPCHHDIHSFLLPPTHTHIPRKSIERRCRQSLHTGIPAPRCIFWDLPLGRITHRRLIWKGGGVAINSLIKFGSASRHRLLFWDSSRTPTNLPRISLFGIHHKSLVVGKQSSGCNTCTSLVWFYRCRHRRLLCRFKMFGGSICGCFCFCVLLQR